MSSLSRQEQAGMLAGRPAGWLAGCNWVALAGLVGWLVGWLAGWLCGWLVRSLAGQLAGGVAGWLAGWLDGQGHGTHVG